MIEVDRLLYCRWVVPVVPHGLVLEDHAIVVNAGRIADILPSEAAAARYRGRHTAHLATHAVTPGLVNAHTHAAMTLLRGVGDDLPLMRWLTERIWPLEQALVSPEFVHDGTRLAALEMLRSGTTCASDMYFYPEAAARGFRALGMRAVVGIIAIEFPTAYAADAEDYLRKGLAARDDLRNDPLVTFTLAPHAPYTVSDATLQRIGMLADELDLPIHTHVHETEGEIERSLTQHGCRPLARLDRLGLVSERLIAVHAVHLDDSEVALLAARGASIAHCPASNLKLGSGVASSVARAATAGANVAIGTDGAASNNRVDMLSELRLAALLAKGATGDASALPAPAVLESATLGGARALGLQGRIGSIEVGKDADLVAFDLAQPETQPLYDVISHLVYCTGREQVTDVWVAGRPVVVARQALLASEQPDLMPRVGQWQNRCQQVLLTAGAS